MPRHPRLSEAELSAALAELPGWSLEDSKLFREYKFANFSYAFGFMATAATAIEKMDHHPEWRNVYSRVAVHLTTHDSGGVTELDVRLAKMLDEIARRLS
jgi:4a-hydroxytetrahydrobiopterin dehydratase